MTSFEIRRGGQDLGTFTQDEVKSQIGTGEIQPTDQIRKSGTSTWYFVHQVPKLAALLQSQGGDPSGQPATYAPPPRDDAGVTDAPKSPLLFPAMIVHGVVVALKSVLTGSLFLRQRGGAAQAGHLFLLVGLLLTVTGGVIVSIKGDSIEQLLWTLGFATAVVLGQYAAWRSIGDGERLLESTPTSIRNTFLLDIMGLLSFLAGIAAFIASLVVAIQTDNYWLAFFGLIVLGLSLLAASAAFNPAICNVQVRETTAGNEAIGLLSFYLKVSLLLAPFLYAGATLVGVVMGGMAIYSLTNDQIPQGVIQLVEANSALIAGGFYPLLLYISFLLYYLLVDVFRSILQIGVDVRHIADSQHH